MTTPLAQSPPLPCSAFKVTFSATYPKGHDRIGGIFLEAELESDDLMADLPKAASELVEDGLRERDEEGSPEMTDLTITIRQNTQTLPTSPGAAQPEIK